MSAARIRGSGRRPLLLAAAGLASGSWWIAPARAAGEIRIAMRGSAGGAHVWFGPRGLLIEPGQTVRWVNEDAGNSHTSTAYHPDNHKPLRMPQGARPWNSGYLLPRESFAVTFEVPGVYDYFCLPHEAAGMVGRIVVGKTMAVARPYVDSDGQLFPAALAQLPATARIVERGRVD